MNKSLCLFKSKKTPCGLRKLWDYAILLLFVKIVVLTSCQPVLNDKALLDRAFYYQLSGQFDRLNSLSDSVSNSNNLNESEKAHIDSLIEISRRIQLDFRLTEPDVKLQLAKYFPDCDSVMINHWVKNKKLEMRLINGEKRYFKNTAGNLFRLDDKARKRKIEVDGYKADSLKLFCVEHILNVVEQTKNSGEPVFPVKLKLTYTVTVKPNAVPDGKIIRCWMPFPREGHARQKNIKLLGSDPENALIAPESDFQRSVYLEKTAQKDKSIAFQITFEVETSAMYFDLDSVEIEPYNTESPIYKEYTCERVPNILFSEKINELSNLIVANETNPLKKVRKIYNWINDSIRWASALEYSIIPNIPEYVLETGHGDCGMQTLLFMTLVRSQGIPAKWQSGWMLHPRSVNLHDWCEVYYEGIGWVPVDQSFGLQTAADEKTRNFYQTGIDSYRLIVNDEIACKLTPEKKYLRSEPYDFQRGELEWEGGNLYFDKWVWNMDVKYY